MSLPSFGCTLPQIFIANFICPSTLEGQFTSSEAETDQQLASLHTEAFASTASYLTYIAFGLSLINSIAITAFLFHLRRNGSFTRNRCNNCHRPRQDNAKGLPDTAGDQATV